MKKINSILAIATVALTSVFGFTSCDKNDDSINQQIPDNQPEVTDPAVLPQISEDVYLYAPATAEQLKYMDVTYTFTADGQTREVKLSEMKEVKDKQRLADTDDMLFYYRIAPDKISEAKIYEFYIGKVKEVNIKSIKYTALTEKTDHEIDAMEGVGLKFASDEVVSTFKVCYLHGFSDIATVADYISYSN